MNRVQRYLLNNVIALDRQINALVGGDPEMTVSGRMGRAVIEGRCVGCKVICWLLDMIDYGHCAKQAQREQAEGSDEVLKL